MNLFDILKDIIKDKTGKLKGEEFNKNFSPFMISRYLSMDARFFEQARIANKYQSTLSKEQLYKLLTVSVPQSNKTFIKYIKKPKKVSDESED